MADEQVGKLLSLLVHDLRNPAATLSANIGFLKEVMTFPDDDSREAFEDSEHAVEALMRGLEQVGWIARSMSGDAVVQVADGDVVAAIRTVAGKKQPVELELELPDEPLRARGGGTLVRLVDVLLANAAHHSAGPVTISASREDGAIVVTLRDRGEAIAPELRDRAFTLAGQHDLKQRSDGRYGRVAGLFAAGLLAKAIDADLEAGGERGAAWFRVRMKPV